MKYWNKGFYLEQSINNDRFEITDERWQELLTGQSNGLEIYTKENGEPDLRAHIVTEEEKIEILRQQRQSECFAIVNRGQVWYNNLTESQMQELRAWYQAWLNVTVTKQIPQKPYWLQ